MERIKGDYIEALQWLKYVLGSKDTVPSISNWRALYDFCDKQKIGGVCEPTRFDVHVDEDVLLDWMALVVQLKKSNEILNQRVEEYFHILENDGIRCCLLKGQGNVTMYPDPNLRFPGDIDLWIDLDQKSIEEYFSRQYPDAKQSFKHLKVYYEGIPVDVHDIPLKLYNPIHQRYLKRWLDENKDDQFIHNVSLTHDDNKVCIPTAKFNAVYQMGHIMIHLLDEGIGLRQFVDYYYVLKSLGILSDAAKKDIERVWRKTGMLRLASGVMWIEQEVLGLPKEYLIIAPNEKRGRLLLEDILEGGNFGKSSKRQRLKDKGLLFKGVGLALHNIKLGSLYPAEMPFKLLGKVKSYVKHLKY